jgi:hypothetical protein
VPMGRTAHEIDGVVGEFRLAGRVGSHVGTFPALVARYLAAAPVQWPVARSLGCDE